MRPETEKLTKLGAVSSHVVVPCVLGVLWRSDLINPVMRVTPLRGFHKEKTHRTETGFPDRLTEQPAFEGYST